jgi:ADP-ribosylation factor GTPase-activating protein 2/3
VLDKWNPDQVLNMMVGGNAKADAFFKKRGWTESGTDKLQQKYTSKAATQYKEFLEAEVECVAPCALTPAAALI